MAARTPPPGPPASEYLIRAGDYSATITAQAAALRRLRHGNRDLVVPFEAGAPIPDYRGIVAAPWPNRIRDGRYTFDGAVQQLALNEPERSTALHGLVFNREWNLQSTDDSSVVLACELGPTTGYPFQLRLEAAYRIDKNGLHTLITATNTGPTAAPYGVCPHPYLVAGPSSMNDWILELPASSYLEVTTDRLLPVKTRPVQGQDFDFRAPRTIGSTKIDHAFTNIRFNDRGRASLTLKDPIGTGVGLTWDVASPWLQIHTADKKPPLPNRIGLAAEPMTCPPDAFNSGTDLIRLNSAGSHQTQWTIFAI
ncbi:aldose 1-epimerase family protein [Arthrobacter sp. NPDC057013]|uniref:aldose 1-epimerase family protein n=1 Tax=Arthrobacter sp. NPDC057013 TaxID=3345999 RepID=UPI00363A8B50